jgi:hypothetical protein
VPKDAKDAQIFFEGGARLFDPTGAPFEGGREFSRWVDLPSDRPGIWHFEPTHNRLVRVKNLPPFFADSAEHWFDPGIAWTRAQPEQPHAAPPETVRFVPGAIQTPNNQALYLRGKRSFTLAAGDAARVADDGGQILPFKQGTIEFWFQPAWGTFTVGDGVKPIFEMPTQSGPGWFLRYTMQSAAESWMQSHVFNAEFPSTGRQPHLGMRLMRQTILQPGEWVHLAYVWGKTSAKGQLLTSALYINGKRGTDRAFAFDNEAEFAPVKFILRGGMEGAVDELRISSSQRYVRDFEPPSQNRELEMDADTRALFHFNGNVEGESFGQAGQISGILSP